MDDFMEYLPTGRDDKPLLFEMGPLEYDFHDIDGLYFMLDRDLSGCMMMMWSKQMDPDVAGIVTLDGKKTKGILKNLPEMGGMWTLGITLKGLIAEYDKEYQLHVEGYCDTDGNVMDPQDFMIRSAAKAQPEEAFREHEAIALQAAREGIVVLKNENNILPINAGKCLNLFGKGVHEFRIGAVGAGKINPRYSINFLEAVRGCPDLTLNEELVDFYRSCTDETPDEDMLSRAKEMSDLALVFLTRPAGENQDAAPVKGEFYLSDDEEALIRKVSEVFSRTVVILNVGYPVDVRFAERYKVDGLVYIGFGGMLAGPALLDILSGKECPSGKLPDTWALDYEDIPSSNNFFNCFERRKLGAADDAYIDTYYEEGIYVGYRYFSSFGVEPAYPFGFGLSYTQFDISSDYLSFDGNALRLSAEVKNTGMRSGRDVLQIYVGKADGELEMPERELVAFEKTRELKPGESQLFDISVPLDVLASFSEEKSAWICAAGKWKVFAGDSSMAELCGTFEIGEEITVKNVKHRMLPAQQIEAMSRYTEHTATVTGKKTGIVSGKTSFKPYAKRESFAPRIVEDEYVMQLSDEELARLSVCASAGWGMEGIGEAGSVYRLEDRDIPYFPVSDGNSGVNLNIRNIGMPSGATIAASFSKELSQQVGRVIGEEAKMLGIPLILAPGFNIHRNPLNGRQPEYFSEDPYLSGLMAGYYAKGLEGTGVAGCYKHFIGNNCEYARKRNQSIIPERALREIYYRNFEYAFSVHKTASIMTAYNAVNGCPTSADEELIQGLLREELGFEGFVMTDWTTYDTVDIAAMIQAGNCWITPGSNDDLYTSQILEGIKNGTINPNRLRENVEFLIRVVDTFS